MGRLRKELGPHHHPKRAHRVSRDAQVRRSGARAALARHYAKRRHALRYRVAANTRRMGRAAIVVTLSARPIAKHLLGLFLVPRLVADHVLELHD
jgi:hypothetical protein